MGGDEGRGSGGGEGQGRKEGKGREEGKEGRGREERGGEGRRRGGGEGQGLELPFPQNSILATPLTETFYVPLRTVQ